MADVLSRIFWALVTFSTLIVLALDLLSYYEQNKSWVWPNIENGALYVRQLIDQSFGGMKNDAKAGDCQKYCVQYKYVSEFPNCSSLDRLAQKVLCLTTIPKPQLVCAEERCEQPSH
ncbi:MULTISPECIES: hypothetical protein [Rhodomicrobium]|uniref:hypothetical protein n=1 Tax=Rhodomicrobium TaxID=1068 RepID=UPI000F73F59F|nr:MULTISPECIES: hypothetical protein [Rhodomicrobium]